MDANDRHLVDAILKRKTLSHADFRRVELLGDDGFDYVKVVLSRAPTAQNKINGLRLLIGGGTRISVRQGALRLPEVFDVAADFLADPHPDVRATAIRIIIGILGLLKTLEKPLETVGGSRRVWRTLRLALAAEPRQVERNLVEKALIEIESTLTE